MGVQEGVCHALVLLQRALLRQAAVDGAQPAALLLPVGHGRLVEGHLLPAGGWREGRERRREEEREGVRGREEERDGVRGRERRRERRERARERGGEGERRVKTRQRN